MRRRGFLKTAAAGAGLLILRSGMLRGADAPSNKLNIAMIGTWGRADAHFGVLKSENIVALCDVNEDHLAHAAKMFPNAKTYVDWRKVFDQKDINAVVCCTTDFTHAFIANWALNRNLHIYCEKPIGNCVEECRVVRANYLKRKDKVATQVGTQRHAIDNFARVKELVRDGAIGELQAAYAWGDRNIPKPGYMVGEGQPPDNFHYDLWLGPSPYHPYNAGYFKGGPGANCLSWNMYWDFGSGQIGDMGSHTMDLAWNALDADLPTSAEAEGEKYNPDVTPPSMHTSFDIPANDWRKEIRLHWYQGGGGMFPNPPPGFGDVSRFGHGAMFKGTQGFIVADFDQRVVIPYGKEANMTYYKPRPKDQLIPPLGGFQQEWINAAKGNMKTTCNFDYGGKLIETMLLGLLAYRVWPQFLPDQVKEVPASKDKGKGKGPKQQGPPLFTGPKKLEYDGAKGRVTNCEEANQLISRKYREGWVLDG
ncbi:MAG: Gfo/Idh/MocA family oxidoreductase [Planctomycetota bacterium]|nr:Gfo/Idh/MocA family oxidoreductase [Planctomycetota bacterium]